MNPNDFAGIFMAITAGALFVGVGSGFVLGLFVRWFMQREEKRR